MIINTNFLYEIISNMIQSLEAKRDYTDEGLSPEEISKLNKLNEMWDEVRLFHDFSEPSEKYTNIREAILTELESRNWSIKDLASETEIRYATLTEYLNGNKGLNSEYIEKCFEKLNLSIQN